MLERFLGNDRRRSLDWDSLSHGAPTIIGLAHLAADAMASPCAALESLSSEARCILFLARECGIIDLRGSNDAFERTDRLLMVHVQQKDGRVVVLKTAGNVRGTVRFLEGLRQLCAAGLVVHHLQSEFSLSSLGFDLAQSLTAEGLEADLSSVHPID